MPTSSNMIGHIYITELVFKQKLYVWYSCCCYELRVITLVAENGASTTHKLAELFFPRKLRRLVGTLRDLCCRERVAGGYDGVEAAYAAGRRSSRRVVGDSGENKRRLLRYEASPKECVKADRVLSFRRISISETTPRRDGPHVRTSPEATVGCCYAGVVGYTVRPNFRSGGPYSLREYGPPRTQLPREYGPPDRVPWLHKTN